MRRGNADSSNNITVSMVNDFFNLSAPRPKIPACPRPKGRPVDDHVREKTNREGRSFKLEKSPYSEE